MTGPRDDLIARGIVHELRDEPLMQGVAPALHLHMTLNRHPEQREVAQQIEHFVAHELIGHAQAFGIQHTPFVEYDGVVQGPAPRQAGAPQGLHFMQEAEGPGAAELALEHPVAEL